MFRRKEEGATDSANPAATTTNGAANESAAPAAASATPSVSYAAPASTQASHSPTAAAARSVVTEAARANTSSPLGNYRPSPIAEFNRGVSARSSEPARQTTSVSTPSSSSFSSSDKSSASSSKPVRRVLTVGNDILLKGEIATCDRLVIEGRVEAKLSDVHTVEIAECGSFKGTAEVEDAEISGVFEGDLIVRNRIVIYASGEVRGNISYGEIEIERGGKMTGQIKTVAGNAKGKLADTSDAKARSAKETVAAA